MAQIAVVGVGYVGLTTAAGMAALGHDVVGLDTDLQRVAELSAGRCPIYESGLPELLSEGLASRRLTFTSDMADVAVADVVFLCVPTPQDEDGAADLSHVLAATVAVAGHLRSGAVLVTKSTVPVGAGEQIQAVLGRTDVAVVSNPEFLREGSAVSDFMRPDRIVVGASDTAAASMISDLYAALDAPVVQTTRRSAELIKYASNAFLSVKLSFVNDLAALCDATGCDVTEVALGMGMDSRIGSEFLKPGPGWGGSCFPKDANALDALATSVGVRLPLITAAIASNERANRRVVEVAEALLPAGLAGTRVACWGIAYKAYTDDIRESPAVSVINRLHSAGASVMAHDPVALLPHGCPAVQVATPEEAVRGANLLIVLTEWPQYRELDATQLVSTMASPLIVDSRNLLHHAQWRGAGATVAVLGRPQ